jgi:hypothetical protein
MGISENFMGTHWELKKTQTPPPSPKENKNGPFMCMLLHFIGYNLFFAYLCPLLFFA